MHTEHLIDKGLFMRLAIAAVLLSGITLISGCTKGLPEMPTNLQTVSDRLDASTPASPLQVVEVSNAFGSVTLQWGGREDSVRWSLTRRVTGDNESDARAFLATIQLIRASSAAGDTLRLSTQSPVGIQGYSFYSLVTVGVPFGRIPFDSTFRKYVIDGVQGTTTVADIGTTFSVRNAHAVVVQRANASCDITSLGGGVVCEIAIPPSGHCTISATNGGIVLKLPTNTSASVDAQAAGGTVTYSNLSFNGLNHQGNVLTGTLGAGNGTIHLQTNGGSIVLQGTVP
jgi:hypothetical protein